MDYNSSTPSCEPNSAEGKGPLRIIIIIKVEEPRKKDGLILDIELGKNQRGYLVVAVFRVGLKGLVDCGSTKTLVGYLGMRALLAAGLRMHKSRYAHLRVANTNTTSIVGEFYVPFNVGGIVRVVTVLYVPLLSCPLILGLDFWRRYHLLPDFVNNTVEIAEVQILDKPPEVTEESKSVSTFSRKLSFKSYWKNSDRFSSLASLVA